LTFIKLSDILVSDSPIGSTISSILQLNCQKLLQILNKTKMENKSMFGRLLDFLLMNDVPKFYNTGNGAVERIKQDEPNFTANPVYKPSKDFKVKFKKFLMIMMFLGFLGLTFVIASAMTPSKFVANTDKIDSYTADWQLVEQEKKESEQIIKDKKETIAYLQGQIKTHQDKINLKERIQKSYSGLVDNECKYIISNTTNLAKDVKGKYFERCSSFTQAEV